MWDPFELLGLPRRPWLEAEAVRRAFQAGARRLHPDSEGGDAERFAELNAAQAALSDPASRLRLLIPGVPIPSMPPDADLGFEVAGLLREADDFARRSGEENNPILRALAAGGMAASRRRIEEVLERVEAATTSAESRLKAADAAWPDVAPEELAALAAECSFLGRWESRLTERLLALRLAG